MPMRIKPLYIKRKISGFRTRLNVRKTWLKALVPAPRPQKYWEQGAGCYAFLWFMACKLCFMVCFLFLWELLGGYVL